MVVDIVCGALLLIFGLFGVFKGFARQIFKFASFFAAVIGAFLLVKPTFDFCYALGFGKSWYDAMAGAFNTDGWLGALGKKITDYAASCGKTSGQFWAGIVMNACLFVALAILLGLAFNILKKIVFPIADMPVIKVFDRIRFGSRFVLGVPYYRMRYTSSRSGDRSERKGGKRLAVKDEGGFAGSRQIPVGLYR